MFWVYESTYPYVPPSEFIAQVHHVEIFTTWLKDFYKRSTLRCYSYGYIGTLHWILRITKAEQNVASFRQTIPVAAVESHQFAMHCHRVVHMQFRRQMFLREVTIFYIMACIVFRKDIYIYLRESLQVGRHEKVRFRMKRCSDYPT